MSRRLHIINAMFSPNRGGIEQAFLDYTDAMLLGGHRVTTVTRPGAWVNAQLDYPPVTIANLGEWDPLAKYRIRKQLKTLKPDLIIAHGNRAFSLFKAASKGSIPVVGVAHNYNIRRLAGADGVLCITQDLCKKIADLGLPAERIIHMPNMVRLPSEPPVRTPHDGPVVIGTMGRFVAKKGFDVFIDALAEMQTNGVSFKAVLGGDGEIKNELVKQAERRGLKDVLAFTGWVTDKDQFFKDIDIFCLPSNHEPFGIVLLEAMAAGLPVVTTASEGPREIVTHEEDALITPLGDAMALAQSMQRLILDKNLAQRITQNAIHTVNNKYGMQGGSARLTDALNQILQQQTPHT